MSESKWDDERRSWWKERIKSYLYVRKFSAALVGGRIHADYASSLGIPRERIFTGYDAVDNLHFRRMADMAMTEREVIRKRHPVIPQRPYFMAVLRLIPRKNISRLIDAYAIYRGKTMMGDPWDLVICGNGQEKAVLAEKVRRMGFEETIHFPGFISYQEIGFWYGLAEAFVHPALVEQWGLVVNEACAAGLSILCSATVGARYDLVIEGENGFLFDPHNVEAMADSLSKMHGAGAAKRRTMGAKSRQIVESCSPEVFAASFVSAASAALERC
jgi:glycosyltransferase involved in cell wall biosynthesis